MKHFNLDFRYGSGVNHFVFYCLSDLHLGNSFANEKQIISTVEEIRRLSETNGNVFWFGGGDMIEAVNKKDRRFDVESIADWVSLRDPIGSEIEYVCRLLKPISNCCLGILEGNHEYVASQMWERDIHQNICSILNVRSYGPSATVNLVCRRGSDENLGGVVTFPGLLSHGCSGSGKGNEERSLREPLSSFDIYSGIRFTLMGHTHDSNSIIVNRVFVERNGPINLPCLAARMGSFLSYGGYAERANYRPLATGSFTFYIAPYKNLITTNFAEV